MLVDGPGPVFQTYFTEAPAVRDYREFAATDRAGMARLQAALLERGVNTVPRAVVHVDRAHQAEVDATVDAFAGALRDL